MIKVNKPVISIIVPIFNVQDYVIKCIESILSQSYTELEIILINDGSTDHCGSIIDSYAGKDSRIKAVHQANKGLSAARNAGLNLSKGDLIGFVDGDDWIEDNMYSELYFHLISSEADISICGINNVDMYGNRHADNILYENLSVISGTYNIMKYFAIGQNSLAWDKLYKRHLFNGIRYPLNKYYEDCFLTYRIMERAKKIVISPEPGYNYVFRSNSISNTKFSVKTFDCIEAFIEQYDYIFNKYPDLEMYVRKNMYNALLWVLQMAFYSNTILHYEKEINDIVDRMRKYPIENCSLSTDDEKLLKILFLDFRKYLVAVKMAKNKINLGGAG